MTEDVLERLAHAVARGKENRQSPWPAGSEGEDGADELAALALASGLEPQSILRDALTAGMRRVGRQFATGEAFIPEILMAARAMKAAMDHLRPHFESGAVVHRGTVVLGTVAGDLHDIGKNVVRMVLEGDGFKVIDLGVDVEGARFIEALDAHPGAHLGMSSLLTTTMVHMEGVARQIREHSPGTRVWVGGAPVTREFAEGIGADGTFPDAYGFAAHLADSVA